MQKVEILSGDALYKIDTQSGNVETMKEKEPIPAKRKRSTKKSNEVRSEMNKTIHRSQQQQELLWMGRGVKPQMGTPCHAAWLKNGHAMPCDMVKKFTQINMGE